MWCASLHYAVPCAYLSGIIGLIGTRYRLCYRQRCVGMSWNTVSLPCLQACAVALGGKSLAALCHAFCLDYKQFGSGAPDLLTIRAVSVCPPSNVSSKGPHHHRGKGQRRSVEECDWTYDWESVLGTGWGNVRVDEGDPAALDLWADEDLLSGRPGGSGRGRWGRRRGAVAGGKQSEDREEKDEGGRAGGMESFFARKTDSGCGCGSGSGRCEVFSLVDSGEGDSVGDEAAAQVDAIKNEEEDFDEQEDSIGKHLVVVDEEAGDEVRGESGVEGATDIAGTDRRVWIDPFLCEEADIELIEHPCSEQGYSWRYECLQVEVKGPTDRLSDTQQRWIHILNANHISTVVCRVKEGVMDLQSGYHRTVDTSETDNADASVD
jgi:hypothetical protein